MSNPYLPTPVRILEVRPETAQDWTYRLAWPAAPRPGQFFEVSVPRLGEAPISVSAIGEGWIEMTIRKVGRVTDGIFALRAGDALWLRGPYGNGFEVERFAGRHLLIAAGGTGLAPVRGMIRHWVQHRPRLRGFDLLLGFRSPGDILFGPEIDAWSRAIAVQTTVDRAGEGWDGHVGVITTLLPGLALPEPAEVEAVVVGPPIMMKFTVAELLQRHLAPERIWVSYERRMSCGIGKCGHCKINDRYVCLDGPVFRLDQARWLID